VRLAIPVSAGAGGSSPQCGTVLDVTGARIVRDASAGSSPPALRHAGGRAYGRPHPGGGLGSDRALSD
jgi:hypothetical protein